MSIPYQHIPSPAFVLDISRLRSNLALMADVKERAGISIILALKGFSMWRVFPLIHEYLNGATASSLAEARLIVEEMGTKAHTYSPAYLPGEFPELAKYSSHVSFNSLTQYEQFAPTALGAGCSIGLRVNPQYSEVSTDLYNPAVPGSRLGILPAQLPSVLPRGIEGFHVHTLCESSAQATEQLILAAEKHFGRWLPHLKWINLGGGHLMTRKGYDVDHLVQVLQAFRERHPHLSVTMEPGSAVVWETGELVSTVLDIVESGGVKTAILDVSFTAHMPDTLEMPYRPLVLGATDPQPGKPTYRLGGVSCLAGDYMSEYSFPEPLRIGDQIVLWDMMHYTMVKTTTFNGVTHPSICLWTEEEQLEVVRQFGYEDFKNRLS